MSANAHGNDMNWALHSKLGKACRNEEKPEKRNARSNEKQVETGENEAIHREYSCSYVLVSHTNTENLTEPMLNRMYRALPHY